MTNPQSLAILWTTQVFRIFRQYLYMSWKVRILMELPIIVKNGTVQISL